ncbi:MAG TPA: sulfatase-like hydrolase/transferase [Acidobacteriota bacterium]|nr:sulfatase-like hydrolase/transferase [Acidobacteriota bacterium]
MKNGFKTALLILATVATALSLVSGCGGGQALPLAEKPERINILLVTIDTLRADYLSCYGNAEVSTPQIDSLAAEGARFTFCVAHNPITLPSHVNILTGTDARVHGVHDNHGFRLAPEAETLAEAIKSEGYDTAAFIGAFVLDRRFGLDQGFDLYDDNLETGSQVPLPGEERRAEAVVAQATEWLQNRGDKPWFVWVHLYDPHAPYDPPPPFDNQFESNPYAGEISYTDLALGKLLTYLKSEDLLEGTLLVLTGDHGEGLGDHGELTHGVLAYNTTMWVPLIIRAPWLAEAGTEVDRRVRHIDLLPTILEAAGVTLPGRIQGESLIPLLAGDSGAPAPDSYFEALSASFTRGWAPLRGIYSGQWKYIELPLPELYDTQRDFTEMDNKLEGRAGTAQRLRNQLASMTAEKDAGLDARVREDEETRRRLTALGYLTGSSQPLKKEYGPEDDPKNLMGVDARIESAAAAASSGEPEQAINILESLVTEYPGMAISYQLLAPLLAKAGRPDEAVLYLERAVGKGLGGQQMVFQLAAALLHSGMSDRAVPMLEELLGNNPDDPEIAETLASWHARAGDAEKAEEMFLGMLEADPSNAEIHSKFGWLLARQERFEEAIEQFNAALHYQPTDIVALHGRGVVYEQSGLLDKAEESFRRVLSLNEMHHFARLRLGFVLLRRGNSQEARAELLRFLQLAQSPEFEAARREASAALEQISRGGY